MAEQNPTPKRARRTRDQMEAARGEEFARVVAALSLPNLTRLCAALPDDVAKYISDALVTRLVTRPNSAKDGA